MREERATREAIWRRCRARVSRKDRRMAQEKGSLASEVLMRSLRCLWRGQGTWLVGSVSDCM
jgi:hypothetical protein